MRKKIFYRVLPFFSLIFAMFFSVPSFAADLTGTYNYNGATTKSGTLRYQISLADDETVSSVAPSTGTVYHSSGDGSLTIVIPVEYTFYLGEGSFLDASTGQVANSFPYGSTSMQALLTCDASYTTSYGILYGSTSGTIKFNGTVVNGGWYLNTGVDEQRICPQTGMFNTITNYSLPSVGSTYMGNWHLIFRGDFVVTFYLDENTGGLFQVELTPTLVFGSRSWVSPLNFYSGDAPVTDGDISDQTNTITSGYDNSSLTGSNSDLSGGLTQYENQENEMLGQVDFTSVAMTDVFSLSDMVSSTSLFGTFMQGVFTNLGTANAIIIISLSLMFALAALGYRKYLRG